MEFGLSSTGEPAAILRPAKTSFNPTPKNEKGTKVFSLRAFELIQ